jgi:hypothetical protein
MTNQLNEVIAHRLRLAAIYLAANRLISEMSNSEIIAIERQEDGKKVLLCALADGSVTEASVNGTSDVTENSRLRVEEIKDDAGYPHYVINRVPRLASSSSAPASSNNNGTGIEH